MNFGREVGKAFESQECVGEKTLLLIILPRTREVDKAALELSELLLFTFQIYLVLSWQDRQDRQDELSELEKQSLFSVN